MMTTKKNRFLINATKRKNKSLGAALKKNDTDGAAQFRGSATDATHKGSKAKAPKKKRKSLFGRVKGMFSPATSMSDIGGGVRMRIKPLQTEEDAAAKAIKKAEARIPKKLSKVKLAIVAIIVIICSLTVTVTSGQIFVQDTGAKANTDLEQYYGILTGEEKKEWDEKVQQQGKAYVQMNTRIEMGREGHAMIRVINPPYSNYKQDVVIYLKDPKKDVFKSDIMAPGTIVEYTEIPGLDVGLYEAVANFTFYNEEGAEKGSYSLDITFEVLTDEQMAIDDTTSGTDSSAVDVPIQMYEDEETGTDAEATDAGTTDTGTDATDAATPDAGAAETNTPQQRDAALPTQTPAFDGEEDSGPTFQDGE